jgi:chemotaxis protein CheD
MNILETTLPVIHLKAGEIYIGDKPRLVATVLGSCISVTMFNIRLKIASICHGALPKYDKNQYISTDNYTESFKYVDFSINYMVEKLTNYGIKPQEIQVKLFGGADMFSFNYEYGNKLTVGKQNIQVALNTIENNNLKILTSDIGGIRGRKIFFYTDTGEVLLKRLKKGGNS